MADWRSDPIVQPGQQAQPAANAPWARDPIASGQPAPAAAVSPEAAATAAGQQAGADTNAAGAALGQAARQATFGLSNYVDAGARNAIQTLKGKPEGFGESLAYERGKSTGEMGAHPYAGTAGGVAGGLIPGAAAALLTGGTGDAAMLAADAGKLSTGSQALRLAAAGAGGAGVSATAEGQTPLQTAVATAAGIILSPLGIPIGYAASKLLPASQLAFKALSDHFKMPASALEAAYDSLVKLHGTMPSLSQLADYSGLGSLKKLAATNGIIAEAANKASDATGGIPASEQLAAAAKARQASVAAGGPDVAQTSSDQLADRDAAMDTAMSAKHPTTGVPLRDTFVNDSNGVLITPHVRAALQPRLDAENQIAKAAMQQNQVPPVGATREMLDRFQTNQATIGDVDTVRKALSDAQRYMARPPIGATHQANPGMAKEFGEAAMKVEALGNSADSRYGDAVKDFRGASDYADGFDHAMRGGSANDLTNADSLTRKALSTPSGLAGYDHGNALKLLQDVSDSIAPSGAPQGATNLSSSVMQGTMSALGAAHGNPVNAVYHAAKAFPAEWRQLSPATQKVLSTQLFSKDPVVVKQAMANLAKGRMTAAGMRQVGSALGGEAATNVEGYLNRAYGNGQ